MSANGRRAVTYGGVTYAPGARFRVIRSGAALDGFTPVPGGADGWRQQLQPGDVITCTGHGPGWGSDPGYGVEFTSAASQAAGAHHCEITPSTGGMFSFRPAPGVLVADDAPADAARRADTATAARAWCDLRCTAEALRAASGWAAAQEGASPGVTLAADEGLLTVRCGNAATAFPGGRAGASQQMKLTPESLATAAAWAEPGDGMADVTLILDDRMLLVTQGDDQMAWDTGGEPASREYLAVAPLDRP